jgi:hypothetical protein
VEQYDLDVVDDEETSCDAFRRMIIGDGSAYNTM